MELTPSAHQDTFARDNLPPQELWPDLEFALDDVRYPRTLNAGAELIDGAVTKFGADTEAFSTPDGRRFSYGQMQAWSNQIANVLVDRFGIVPGNRVLLRSPNNPETVACWLAVLKAGAVVVTTMHALRATEILPLITKTKPQLALADYRFVDELQAAMALELGDTAPAPVIPYGGDGAQDLMALAAEASTSFTPVPTAADDVALFGPTSGTTGVPKITMHFHRDILAIADTFGKHVLKLQAGDKIACTAPFAFTFGLGAQVVFPLRFGANSLLVEKATPLELAQLVHEHRANVLFTAPTGYRAILKEGREDLLAGVQKAVSAGEHLPKDTWELVHRRTGLRLIDGIGATELLHIFISASGDDIRPGTTGKAVPGYRATILDIDGNELGPNELGRLAVKGPTGCRYLADERQHAYIVNGWNVTGDTFSMDEDGYFIYQARSDNMIVSSGYNIGAPEVENAINRHSDVVESAVVGKPDEARGTVVCAFVVLREGVAADEGKAKELQDFVKAQIAPYKYPRDVRFVDALPRNPSGKLQHFKLRQQVAGALA